MINGEMEVAIGGMCAPFYGLVNSTWDLQRLVPCKDATVYDGNKCVGVLECKGILDGNYVLNELSKAGIVVTGMLVFLAFFSYAQYPVKFVSRSMLRISGWIAFFALCVLDLFTGYKPLTDYREFRPNDLMFKWWQIVLYAVANAIPWCKKLLPKKDKPSDYVKFTAQIHRGCTDGQQKVFKIHVKGLLAEGDPDVQDGCPTVTGKLSAYDKTGVYITDVYVVDDETEEGFRLGREFSYPRKKSKMLWLF
ncbi:hypothetical protein QR680_002913 [Steinernema hermaphroditum]|uniref:Uncharacterized protein n=1 Tax=Steinernema hermaphroditum TaxID=289476 RepID=A0AA39H5I7_9BILA|nr:hypothetical protein QR680_002913 [Steinernema hermaphroditum]